MPKSSLTSSMTGASRYEQYLRPFGIDVVRGLMAKKPDLSVVRKRVLDHVLEHVQLSAPECTAEDLLTTHRELLWTRLKEMRSGLPRPNCKYVPPVDRVIDALLKEFPWHE